LSPIHVTIFCDEQLGDMEETCLEEGPAVNFERATLEIANTDREFRRESLRLSITIFNHF